MALCHPASEEPSHAEPNKVYGTAAVCRCDEKCIQPIQRMACRPNVYAKAPTLGVETQRVQVGPHANSLAVSASQTRKDQDWTSSNCRLPEGLIGSTFYASR
jgi:hypothetical protein